MTVSKGKETVIVFLGVMAIGLSVAFFLYYVVDRYSLIYYWDSISHMVAARKLVDWSENPGLNQIGTVWMPLPHFLLLPFTLIDMLFTTGFAGTALSLPCLALTSVFIYKIVKTQSASHVAAVASYVAIAGALLYATNPNFLYLGITSMTEAPFMLFFVASAYYFQKWLQHGSSLKHLLLCSIFLSFATLCKYEGWFLPVFFIIVTGMFMLKNREKSQKQKIFAILASILSLTSMVFWLAWNQYHYGDPFEFSNTELYSASWYAENRPFRDLLFLQPANVMSIYSVTAFTIYGPILLGTGAAGYFFIYRKNRVSGKNIVLLFLAMPAIFTIISLIIGIGEMSYWFNARFMVLLSPLVIVMACILLAKFSTMTKNRKVMVAGAGVLFIWQLASPAFVVPTYSDAIGGYSVKENLLAAETGEALKSLYNGNGSIMILTGSGLEHRVMVTSGIALRNFDEIIEHSTWKASFREPWSYDRWMVITNKPGTDALNTTRYWLDRMDELGTHYKTVYENEYYKIMVLK